MPFKINFPQISLPKFLKTSEGKATPGQPNFLFRLFQRTVSLFSPRTTDQAYQLSARKMVEDSGGHSLRDFKPSSKKLPTRKAKLTAEANRLKLANKKSSLQLEKKQYIAELEQHTIAKLVAREKLKVSTVRGDTLARLYKLATKCDISSAKLNLVVDQAIFQNHKQLQQKLVAKLDGALEKDLQDLNQVKAAKTEREITSTRSQNKYKELEVKLLNSQVNSLLKRDLELARAVKPSGEELLQKLEGLVKQGGYRQSKVDKLLPVLKAAGYTTSDANPVREVKKYVTIATNLVRSQLIKVAETLNLSLAEYSDLSGEDEGRAQDPDLGKAVELRGKNMAAKKQQKFIDAYQGKPTSNKIDKKEYREWVRKYYPDLPDNETALNYFDPNFFKEDPEPKKK